MTRGPASLALLVVALGLAAASLCAPAWAQTLDCNRLAAQIAAASQGGSGGRYAAAAQKQRSELARTSAYAQSLGCDRPQFLFFGNRPPQCDGINAQVARMQANLQGLSQAGGENGRAILQARFDAYCRGTENYGTARSFFDRLFDTGRQERLAEPPPETGAPQVTRDDDEDDGLRTSRGGSQAICVRTCDGGFFPMSVAARRRDLSDLQDLCTALCPGTEAKLFTRVPGREVSTAVSADGQAYGDLPNALKFEKSFDKTCTCKPADKSWVEALVDAERILGEARKGDILVTPERAEELSRLAGPAGAREPKSRKFDAGAVAKAVAMPPQTPGAIERDKGAGEPPLVAGSAAAAGSDGERRKMRMIAPQL